MSAIERITKAELLDHLIELDRSGRHMRFGYQANDEAIKQYVEKIDEDDILIGIRKNIISPRMAACMHLAFDKDHKSAEMGISTLPENRRRGYAERLLRYSIDILRNRQIKQLYSVCLPENQALLKMLNKLNITAIYNGGDKEAHIAIPTVGLDSVLHELQNERLYIMDTTMRPWAEVWAKMLRITE